MESLSSIYGYVYEMLFTPPWLGWLLYWLPVAVNLPVYTLRTVKGWRQDVKRRSEAIAGQGIYRPILTVGVIMGRLLMTFLPFLNAVMMVTDAAWAFFNNGLRVVGELLDFPVVPERKNAQLHRDSRPGA